MTNKAVRIAGAGICCLDHIVVSPRVRWGDTTSICEYCIQGGGLVATALVACTRLGAQTELISLLGKDAIAEQILEELDREGVSIHQVTQISEGASPFSFIHVDADNGERTIFHRHATGLTGQVSDLSPIAHADVLVVDGYYPDLVLKAINAARAHNVPIVADATPNDTNREWLRYVDILIAPHHYVREGGFDNGPHQTSDTALNAALDAIHTIGPSTAVITLGSKGWVASDSSGRICGSAFSVEVVDTVGAGDVFHGAFAFGVAQGWDTARNAEFASAVAALKCTAVGGRTGIPSLKKTMAFLREHSSNDWS